MTAHRGGHLVSGRYGVSDRFRCHMLNMGVSGDTDTCTVDI